MSSPAPANRRAIVSEALDITRVSINHRSGSRLVQNRPLVETDGVYPYPEGFYHGTAYQLHHVSSSRLEHGLIPVGGAPCELMDVLLFSPLIRSFPERSLGLACHRKWMSPYQPTRKGRRIRSGWNASSRIWCRRSAAPCAPWAAHPGLICIAGRWSKHSLPQAVPELDLAALPGARVQCPLDHARWGVEVARLVAGTTASPLKGPPRSPEGSPEAWAA